ncbi:hypothetical protein JOQ06_003751 [Pogonophryne albipinna]|uniref:Uncharacterized protein n=1 Tax=Pogonophryne albipinna TaxID=1090488 RepID=A0AAD6AHJ1_9TELE|nr:hypothetical protein JOQ06_003751 [Pogonophryne albipinna]
MVRDSHWTDGAASAHINVMVKNIDPIQPSQRQQVIPRVHPRVLPLARVEVPPNITQLKAFSFILSKCPDDLIDRTGEGCKAPRKENGNPSTIAALMAEEAPPPHSLLQSLSFSAVL